MKLKEMQSKRECLQQDRRNFWMHERGCESVQVLTAKFGAPEMEAHHQQPTPEFVGRHSNRQRGNSGSGDCAKDWWEPTYN